ncbi:MAG: GntR family transcriptional regulator [Lewinellaceae bacterium]|nr:GntR family transcriptional regulator [Lewinellaceae bacterium]
MIQLGEINSLKIVRQTYNGLTLTDEEGSEEALLPRQFVPRTWNPGDTLQVFVFKDSNDSLIATTDTPLIKLNEFACLKVRDVNDHGAFLEWGLDKDLFVPFREQPGKMIPGNWYIVYLYLDDQTDRLAASGRYQRFFQEKFIRLKEGEEVDLLIDNQTELGHNVIINNRYRGLVYENEIFEKIRRGDRCKGYVKLVREDGKIDVSLQKPGYAKIEPNGEKILAKLKANQGFLRFTDKSDPDDIIGFFQMSKKTFKKALGTLYKQRLIRLEPDGIYLV